MIQNNKNMYLKFSKFFGAKKKIFFKETKDLYFNSLNKIKWGPDERSASDFSFNSISAPPSIDRNSAMLHQSMHNN